MKIYVYAIAKNEEKFAARWYESVKEADGVFVLDTGSSDDTVKILEKSGAVVKTENIMPWRFDTARNRALSLVPDDADICVSVDIDEVFLPGWRQKLEKAAADNPGANLFSCYYAWSQNKDGGDGITFYIKKIHRRSGFVWKGIVHEVVSPMPGVRLVECEIPGAKLIHMPDDDKSRAQYLPLLEQAVKEEPENDRNSFYLGREYYFRGKNAECVRELTRHLSLPSACWDEERSASRRFLANAYARLGDDKNALRSYIMSAGEYFTRAVDSSRKIFLRKRKLGRRYFRDRRSIENRKAVHLVLKRPGKLFFVPLRRAVHSVLQDGAGCVCRFGCRKSVVTLPRRRAYSGQSRFFPRKHLTIISALSFFRLSVRQYLGNK